MAKTEQTETYRSAHTLTDGMGVRPDMSTSSTPGSNDPEVKFADSMNQLLIMFTVNSLQENLEIRSTNRMEGNLLKR